MICWGFFIKEIGFLEFACRHQIETSLNEVIGKIKMRICRIKKMGRKSNNVDSFVENVVRSPQFQTFNLLSQKLNEPAGNYKFKPANV